MRAIASLLLLPLAACSHRDSAADQQIAGLEARVAKLEAAMQPATHDKAPHTLLISWTDVPGTISKSYPDAASCDAAKASLLDENRKTSESIPTGARLSAPPHLAKPVCMVG